MSDTPKKRFYEVDLLRFIAAFAVLLFHYAFRGGAADDLTSLQYPWLAPVAKYGYLGVDLFFMISGFVILMTASGGSTKHFVISRIVRLYPAYWMCCTATWLVSLVSSRGRHVASVTEYLANMTMLNGFVGIPYVDSVYWSLLVELKFYFLVFVVLLLRQIHRAKWLLGLWLLASLATSIFSIRYVGFFIIPEFAPYFIAGAMFYLASKEGFDPYKALVIVVSFVAATWHAIQKLAELREHYGTDYSPVVVCAAEAVFFIVFFLVATGRTQVIASKKFFVLGTLTYPLYLLHQNIGFTLINALLPHLNVHFVLWGVTVLMLVVVYFVTLAEKAAAKPMKKLLTSLLKPTTATAALFLLPTFVFGCSGCRRDGSGPVAPQESGPARPPPGAPPKSQPASVAPSPSEPPLPLSPECAALYPQDWQPVWTRDNVDVPAMPKPPRGKPFLDPTFKTCVVRVTDHAADKLAGFARHEYSRRQAFNANDTKLLITANDGTWHLYDAKTYKWIRQLEGLAGDAEPQWHATNPDIFYFVGNNGVGCQFFEMNVATGKWRTVADFNGRIKKLWPGAFACWTHDYGSPSADSRYFAFEVADENWKGLGVFTYDRETDQILGTFSLPPGSPQPLPTITPSGKYVVVSWGKDGGDTERFTLDFKNRMKVTSKIEHADIALDANGEDTYVSIDYDASGGPIYMVNLETGKRTDLLRTYVSGSATAVHFSGKAFRKPGWVLVSTYADYGAKQWFHRRVFAMELTANPRIVNLAHHHSVAGGYFTEPHASVNRDFTKIVFNSNWDVKSDTDMDTYMIQIPPNTLELAH